MVSVCLHKTKTDSEPTKPEKGKTETALGCVAMIVFLMAVLIFGAWCVEQVSKWRSPGDPPRNVVWWPGNNAEMRVWTGATEIKMGETDPATLTFLCSGERKMLRGGVWLVGNDAIPTKAKECVE